MRANPTNFFDVYWPNNKMFKGWKRESRVEGLSDVAAFPVGDCRTSSSLALNDSTVYDKFDYSCIARKNQFKAKQNSFETFQNRAIHSNGYLIWGQCR